MVLNNQTPNLLQQKIAKRVVSKRQFTNARS